MALMPGLQINVGQQLKLTPQLQQSIKILQYSALEVQQTIEATLETNYMLEVEDDALSEEDLLGDSDNQKQNEDKLDSEAPGSDEQPLDINHDEKISEDLEIDCNWEEVYSDYSTSTTTSSQSNEDFVSAENYTAEHESLHDHLYWQSDIYPWNPGEDLIADFLIDDINDEGYLTTPLTELLESIQSHYPESEFDLESLESVLKTIQQFEPTGVGARNVQESLLLQLANMQQTPYVVTAKQLISEHFDWLSFHDHKRIKKMYGLNDEELTRLFKLIQSLNPRPGRDFSSTDSEVIIPDLRLKRTKEGWLVELNSDAFPRLKVNSMYIDLANQLDNSEQSKKIKEQLFEAKGLIKSIHSRGETLLKVGTFIVERQHAFFEEGELAMQPLVLRDVAEHLGLHESTISRATNQKYIQTPRGTFELKYFFSSGVSQYGSADQSAVAIKAHIKGLIDKEDPKKPLSDNKLMELLETEKEISVARRTIAKYREALGIPSSSERKKINKYKL
ncbi:MAG: RNA polymerase factor sigma-54 [Thiomicrorhabdus chilensis]|uniref:RNA polymerase factor sigma-54 n=1 Tax=Thiomicrorhabdus chilensis TaxID=63656 RepID=UPI00299ED20B|nr:RNA polymerase factor sigma-54 [Thiomicrorhabdus chilensis]MDX1348181.1 RNA polymerase factor sigma-54 [Thiomicrorhabdus chilensis]